MLVQALRQPIPEQVKQSLPREVRTTKALLLKKEHTREKMVKLGFKKPSMGARSRSVTEMRNLDFMDIREM